MDKHLKAVVWLVINDEERINKWEEIDWMI